MSKQGGSTALILVATGFFMFLTGCETSKHAEVMGAESLAAKKQAEVLEASDSSGIPLEDQGLSQETISSFSPEEPPGATRRALDRGISEVEEPPTVGEMASADEGAAMPDSYDIDLPETVSPGPPPIPDSFPSGNRGPAAGFGPEGPAMPSFRDTDEMGETAETIMSPMEEPAPTIPEESFDPGPTGYEGQTFESPSSSPSGFMPQGLPLPTFGEDLDSEPQPEAEPEAEPEPEPEPEGDTVVEAAEMVEAVPPPAEFVPMEAEDVSMSPTPLSEIADVFFDFDQYAIRSDAAATLVQNARILQNEHQGVSVLIEGHCDERGTEDYNMVLGERRAQAVKRYLVDLGVPASDIQIVSYGKERPFCTEHNDACWDQNRRGHFVIQ